MIQLIILKIIKMEKKINIIEIGNPPINTNYENYTTEDLEHIKDPTILLLRLQNI